MFYSIYIILSMIVAGFAVRDYAQETARRNILYLSGVWVAFCILWPLVIGKAIHKAFESNTGTKWTNPNPIYSKWSVRNSDNCNLDYLEKVNETIKISQVSLDDITRNEFNFNRRLSVQELDLMAKASVYGITPNLREIENIEQLLAHI